MPSTDASTSCATRSTSGHESAHGSPPRVSLVIPTLNEERNIGYVLGRLPSSVDEVVLVDGRSTDETIAVAKSLCPDVHVVLEPRPGKGWALSSGFAAATGDIIVMIDADGSMDPHEIDLFIEAIDCGADFVKGSRYLRGGGSDDFTLIRSLGNKAIGGLVNTLFGTRHTDLCYGFMAFRSSVREIIDPMCPGFEVETLMNIRARHARLVVAEVASFESPRLHGGSNLSVWRDGARIARSIVRERCRRRPLLPAPVEEIPTRLEAPVAA